ncbi:hypothetical protein [Synechococcus sp. UW140]|nr:hypothetical protein [Synechococcus sp. UW140]
MTAVQGNGACPSPRLNENRIAAAKPATSSQALGSQSSQNNTAAAAHFR